jgi:Flp pilus assembly pilin Flp
MEPMRNRLRRLSGDEEGATVVEYAVILALIIAVVYITIWAVGLRIQQGLEDFNEAFEAAKNGP